MPSYTTKIFYIKMRSYPVIGLYLMVIYHGRIKLDSKLVMNTQKDKA
jgi:hypothetical protein